MVFITSCARHKPTVHYDNGCVCCEVCGKVLHQDVFTEEPTFVKGAGGESRVAGSYVKSIQSGYSESFRRTIDKGRDEIDRMVAAFNISGGDSIINPACSFYQIAVERNFTRGRRTEQVAAACLYIACRVARDPKPFLLIDFSEFLGINVYVLGAVFLQLCQLLSLGEHPTIVKPVDPSLYIPRFAEKLLKERNMKVCGTALHIIASMKRDWIQTGRKPSGLCGAALYISALSHGYRFSKSDIVKIVHICEVTLTKRLMEFENTDSGSLTVEELIKNASEVKACELSEDRSLKSGEVLCEHKNSGKHHFAHGLCRSCYEDFVELSGGLHGGSEPPAFQRAERERIAMESANNQGDKSNVFLKPSLGSENIEQLERSQRATKNERLDLKENDSNSAAAIGDQIEIDGVSDACQKSMGTSLVSDDESDGLSDIDDVEVSGYLNNEEEMRFKKIIWEEMNKEYLQEQAAAAAAKMESQASFQNSSDELRAAHELAAAAAAAVAKSRKERKRKQDVNANPAQTAAEAAHQMLIKKRLSSKINYDVLETLFAEKPSSDSNKKLKASNDDGHAEGQSNGEKEHDGDMTDNYDELGQGYENLEQEDVNGMYGNELLADFENEEDVYGYNYNNGEEEY
ncbi:transcription factor IIIB 60 kDa subunit-like isoform X1 [Juglans microcarpa x Juglans regia]|uniref:transcription factor IIIB 60 kDa subunit-like isoform X1 n=1 Tax=Juglans microcarpa x Juglans regia TaxID=2249226 RepID=UPI001B7D9A07|nr:transcription factor IIIB 60 kDa subunit-like isoform X1 [Juglans microcarpa x Juglans regia]XP_040997423.1 transcription factor IIIB 60 kDa subunit-like isoform X1 [Juglans microcarpa x Juglans regia]XP_040997424.1 transcription factor IIIB 60 kDa subunit-like isoform X1 [Juglans microcarpa x Juglans regia]XP_040997425.1 transcription factor IIIB 60 kDa subunit-like isoform X1 [Juglans microcarpa x Juglans regia]XP_040997426.1 transcription factor IIIB 60 kDa subunit-like isoform X1 [Juglan